MGQDDYSLKIETPGATAAGAADARFDQSDSGRDDEKPARRPSITGFEILIGSHGVVR